MQKMVALKINGEQTTLLKLENVDKKTYDQTIETLKEVGQKTKLSPFEKDKALKRLL